MNQKTYLTVAVALFVLAAFIGGYLLRGERGALESAEARRSPATAITLLPSVAVAASARPPALHTVTFTALGPSPRNVFVNVGDAVRFRNAETVAMWPVSDPHPAHTLCPELDAGRGLQAGEEYTLTFTSAKVCAYHNHLDPTNTLFRGSITVR